eukprot:Em0011g1028a
MKHSLTSSAIVRQSVACSYTFVRRTSLKTQFSNIKKQYPGYILLFQVGDFYEIYGDDAVAVASKTALRVCGKNETRMAGFPVRSLSDWQRTLVEAGFQLAICNQIPAAPNSSKTRLMTRSIVKLVTPGTLVEPYDHCANYLMCVSPGPGKTLGLAWVDISTAEFQVATTEIEDLEEDLERIRPSEVLLPDDLVQAIGSKQEAHGHPSSVRGLLRSPLLRECHLTPVPRPWYTEDSHPLQGLQRNQYSSLELSAACALLLFVKHTQRDIVPYFSVPVHFARHSHMAIDPGTRKALEMIIPLHNNPKKATLLGCIDRTSTAAGFRLLKTRLSSPLMHIEEINRRLDAVGVFVSEPVHLEALRTLLRSCADLERTVQKIATGFATVFELRVVRDTLRAAGDICEYLQKNVENRDHLCAMMSEMPHLPDLLAELDQAIGHGKEAGGYILGAGYSAEVDDLREQIKQQEGSLSELTECARREVGIPISLVPHKNFGRVFEVTKAKATRIDLFKDFIRLDQTSGKVRYSHLELQRLNTELQDLESNYVEVQAVVFKRLCDKVMSHAEHILSTARALAQLDVTVSLATVAVEKQYCRPVLVPEPVFRVQSGVHPLVESHQRANHFVTNDCFMDDHRLWIVTGPNMGGKSTFLRQNAMICLLAQMGSYVPAQSATLGVVDRLFARVGASDNILRHMSTFHVEMTEVANILANATAQSYVVLDEVGRGTSTEEGYAIAQAVLEHLHTKIGCRALMSTHYHQLAHLDSSLVGVGCYMLVATRMKDGGLFFTYRVQPGCSQHSFGIDVANLAGLPTTVIDRAKELLRLEYLKTGKTTSLGKMEAEVK